jgi:hypothetical protein
VEKILHNFKKNVEKLANNIIITDEEGKNTTEFDVLLYMCHRGNMERFDNTDQHGTSSHVELGTATGDVAKYATIPRRSSCYGIKEVTSDVNKIMKLFIEFRYQLSSIHDKACPEDIKSEFSTEIIDMGKTIYPFVSTRRQEVIQKVLRYFGSKAEPPNAGNESTELLTGPSNVDTQQSSVPGPSSTNQEANQGQTLTESTSWAGPSTADTELNELLAGPSNAGTQQFSVPGPSSTNHEANQGQTSSQPGDNTIKRAIPYINYFRYNKGEMSCNIECKYLCVKYLQSCVERRITGVIEKQNEIRDGIKKFWPAQPSEPADQLPEGDLLHLIRMVMFKMLDNSRSKFFNEERLKKFVENVKSIVNLPKNLDKDTVKNNCEGELEEINKIINILRRDNFKPILEDKTTSKFLHDHAEDLRMFVEKMIKKHNIGIDTIDLK